MSTNPLQAQIDAELARRRSAYDNAPSIATADEVLEKLTEIMRFSSKPKLQLSAAVTLARYHGLLTVKHKVEHTLKEEISKWLKSEENTLPQIEPIVHR